MAENGETNFEGSKFRSRRPVVVVNEPGRGDVIDGDASGIKLKDNEIVPQGQSVGEKKPEVSGVAPSGGSMAEHAGAGGFVERVARREKEENERKARNGESGAVNPPGGNDAGGGGGENNPGEAGRSEGNVGKPMVVEGQGVVDRTDEVRGEAAKIDYVGVVDESVVKKSWYERMEREEREQKEKHDKLVEEEVRKLNAEQLREVVENESGFGEAVAVNSAGQEWHNRVSDLGKTFRRVTGGDFKDYVLEQIDQERKLGEEEYRKKLVKDIANRSVSAVAKDEVEKAEAINEFKAFLEKTPGAVDVLVEVVGDETRAVKGEPDDWRVPVVKPEEVAEWEANKGKVVRTSSGGGKGVEINAKPIYEMDEEERTAKFEEEVNKRVQQEKKEAEEKGETISAHKLLEVFQNTSKYWGLALFADEGLEFVQHLISHGKVESPNIVREFREWRQNKGKKEDESQTEKERSDEERDAVAKEMRDIQSRLGKIAEKEIDDPDDPLKVTPEDRILEKTKRERRELLWEQFRDEEKDELQRPHVAWKTHVSNEIAAAISQDMSEEKNMKEMPPGSGFERHDPLANFLYGIDGTINRLENIQRSGRSRDEYEEMQLAWYNGTRRNVELEVLRQEQALYKSLKVEGSPEISARATEVADRIKRLEIEAKYLNLSGRGVKPETLEKTSLLASRYVDYLMNAGENATFLSSARVETNQAEHPEATDGKKKGPENGTFKDRYGADEALMLQLYLNWGIPGTEIDQEKMKRTINFYSQNGSEKEKEAVMRIGKLRILAREVAGDDPTNAETSLNLRLDREEVLSLLGDETLRVGLVVSCEKRGIKLGRDGKAYVDYNSREYERYHSLPASEMRGWSAEIRAEIARKIGVDDPNGSEALYAFISAMGFMKLSRLDDSLLRTYVKVNQDGSRSESPGFFHPLVNKSVWELEFPDYALSDTASKATSESKLANVAFVKSVLKENYQIGGRDWREVLPCPINLGSMLFAEDVLEKNGGDKVQLLGRMWTGTIENREVVSNPTLGEAKRRRQMLALRKWYLGGEMPKLLDKYKAEKGGDTSYARKPYLRDLSIDATRIVDEMGLLDRPDVDEIISKLVGSLLVNMVGISVDRKLEVSELGAVKIASDIDGPHEVHDPKKDVDHTIDLSWLAEWMMENGKPLRDNRFFGQKVFNVTRFGDSLKIEALREFLKNNRRQELGRWLAWGDVVDTRENMEAVLGRKPKYPGFDTDQYGGTENYRLWYFLGWK